MKCDICILGGSTRESSWEQSQHSDVLAESLSPGFCIREFQRTVSIGKLGCTGWVIQTGVRGLGCPYDWGTQTGCQTNKSWSPTVSEFILFEFRHQRCGKKVAPLKACTTTLGISILFDQWNVLIILSFSSRRCTVKFRLKWLTWRMCTPFSRTFFRGIS